MKDINDLIIRINTETSIFFLGQEYEESQYVTSLKKILSDPQKKIIFPDETVRQYSEVMDSIIDYCEEEPDQKKGY